MQGENFYHRQLELVRTQYHAMCIPNKYDGGL